MYLQEREAESKIKGNKKDLEKTGKLFECGRALDCKKNPCSPVGTCTRLVCARVGAESGQTFPARALPTSP